MGHGKACARGALLVPPADVVGGDKFYIGESAQRDALERRVSANAFVFIEADGGLAQTVA